ncbi:MAG TPA: hypothetical protein VHD83_06785 [Puia sp.]|nr:hypothetical protein [Puia sp.]
MKGAVYILLMVTLAYLAEAVRMPSYLVEQARSEAADCCPMMKGQQCPHQQKGAHDTKDMKGCCNSAASCTSCPLCYTAELAAPYTSAGSSSLIKKGYPPTPDQPLADYAASSWKPPNA